MTEVVDAGTLVRFIAYVQVAAACGFTLFYAAKNGRSGTLGVEIWRYVILAMVAGVGYAVAGSAELFGVGGATTVLAARWVLQLFVIVLLSLAMRELFYERPYRDAAGAPVSLGTARGMEAAFMAVAVAEFGVVIAVGLLDVVLAVGALGSAAFATYGVSFAASIRSETLSSGTVVDTMLLQFIAVLTCLGMVGLVEGARLLAVPPVVVDSAVSVFLVMAATFLITLAVRLKGNVDTLRP